MADGLAAPPGTRPLLVQPHQAHSRPSLRHDHAQRAGTAWLWATAVLTLGALVTAAALAPPATAQPARALMWLLFLGSSAHVASTGWLYTLPDIRRHAARHRARYIWLPAGLIAGTAVTAAVVAPTAMAWLLLPYFAWQFFHYQKQNLGMAALAASSRRLAPLRPLERRALLASGAAGIAGLMAHPGLLQLGLHFSLGWLFVAAALTFTGAAGAGLAALARRAPADRPAGYCLIYLLSLLFSLPVFVFSSPYAAVGGMTIAHGFQYLLLVALVAGGTGQGSPRVAALAMLFNIALVGGAALAAASHLHSAAPALRLAFGASLGAVMAHFVIDAGLWRLREAFPRAFMTGRVPYLVPLRAAPARPVSSPADIA